MRGTHGTVALGVAIGVVASACGGASFDGSVYRGAGVSFRVAPTPSAWHRVDLAGADLAFRDEPHEASILVNSRCTTSDRDAPLTSLTEHLIIGTTDRRIVSEETIPFDGREARHTVLRARLDGVAMTYDLFVMKKDGCVFDLVYVAPEAPAAAASGVTEFDEFVKSFHTLPAAG
jgi:hypothetical protein